MSKLLMKTVSCTNCGAKFEGPIQTCEYCGAPLAKTIEGAFGASNSQTLGEWIKKQKENPESGDANFGLGLTYLNLENREEALVYLRKAVSLAPEMVEAHLYLAIALFNDGDINASSPEWCEFEKEVEVSYNLAPEMPETGAFKRYFQARNLADFDLAEAEYKGIIDACPNIAIFHNNLGLLYGRNKKQAEAEVCYRNALKIKPDDIVYGKNLSYSLYVQEKYEDCIEQSKKTFANARVSKTKSELHNRIGLCFFALGRYSDSITEFEKAIALGDNESYKNNLQRARDEISKEQARMPLSQSIPALLIILIAGYFIGNIFWVSLLISSAIFILVFLNTKGKKDAKYVLSQLGSSALLALLLSGLYWLGSMGWNYFRSESETSIATAKVVNIATAKSDDANPSNRSGRPQVNIEAPSSKANWKVLAKNDVGQDIYIESSTMQKSDKKVTYWAMFDFSAVREKDGISYQSVKQKIEADCSDLTFRVLASLRYSENLGNGDVVSISDSSTDSMPIKQAGLYTESWKVACEADNNFAESGQIPSPNKELGHAPLSSNTSGLTQDELDELTKLSCMMFENSNPMSEKDQKRYSEMNELRTEAYYRRSDAAGKELLMRANNPDDKTCEKYGIYR